MSFRIKKQRDGTFKSIIPGKRDDQKIGINIYMRTAKRLHKIGDFAEPYDHLINKLIDSYEGKKR